MEKDNARKFITPEIDLDFLKAHNAVSFDLIVDWLEANELNEKKLAYKKYEDKDAQILFISKITEGTNRTSEKRPLSKEEYENLLTGSVLHLQKHRTEFNMIQNNVNFSVKYDVFNNGSLRILEIDASSEQERDSFSIEEFPYTLAEVTGDLNYYGYRIVKIV